MTKGTQNIFIGILSLIILIFFIAYYFLYGYIFALGQSNFDVSQKLQQESLQGQNIKQSTDLLNQIMPQINTIDSYFVSSDGEVGFIDKIESNARAFSLVPQIDAVQIENSKDLSVKGLQYVTLKLSVKGTWVNVYKFVSFLQNMPYQIVVRQADMANLSGSTWSGAFIIAVVKQTQ